MAIWPHKRYTNLSRKTRYDISVTSEKSQIFDETREDDQTSRDRVHVVANHQMYICNTAIVNEDFINPHIESQL